MDRLIDRAIDLHGEDLVNEHIKSASEGESSLAAIRDEAFVDGYSVENRALLGKASRTRKAGWFKSVTWMEGVGRDIVGPDLADADAEFTATIEDIFEWAGDGG